VSDAFFRTLAREAAARYPARDRFARHFAFGKLTRDPVFGHLLSRGLIASGARVLDLGCGQGLLAALLAAARGANAAWPAGWAPAPDAIAFRGIDLMQRDIERAAHANASGAQFTCGDIRAADFGSADVVVILDVLHYIDYAAQEDVLRRVRHALGAGGVLLLRVGDESESLRFRYTVWIDRAVMALRGHRLERLYCKPLAQWVKQLEDLGFAVAAAPMSAGTPFANVLLVARYHSG
jgi:2-polyprenyl-3-methyl-5-hydroxy-6-metoxy-1,4-benzoquinol methylase